MKKRRTSRPHLLRIAGDRLTLRQSTDIDAVDRRPEASVAGVPAKHQTHTAASTTTAAAHKRPAQADADWR